MSATSSREPAPPEDLDYIRKRNALIPAAEKTARLRCGSCPTGSETERERWRGEYNAAFHAAMTHLCSTI